MATADTVYVSFTTEIQQGTTLEVLLGTFTEFANQGIKTVHLLLSSPGGDVTAGITLYNSLRAMPFKLIAHNVGSVNSISNLVFLAAEERYACKNSSFMFHGVGIDVTSAIRLDERKLRETLDSLIADQKRIGSIIAERTKLSTDEVAKLFLGVATKDAEYAKTAGIVDDIRDVKIPAGAPIKQLIFQRQRVNN